jgi:hypothetical protein
MREYLGKLTSVPGYKLCKGAELCMHLRLECLPLRAMHSQTRGSETAAARQLRECCPCCQQAPETPTHFLFECPAYAQARNTTTGYIAKAQANQGGDP